MTKWTLRGGQVIRAHDPGVCRPPCAVHSPSRHHMREWPQLWRDDRLLMERICPCGIGHPDPDHIAFIRRVAGVQRAGAEGVHGCCGHCEPKENHEHTGE